MGSTVSRLGIGTAQFGFNYGISNTNGNMSKIEVAKILENASKSKISLIDRATSYGSCEKLLGQPIDSEVRFKIITKTPVAKANPNTMSHVYFDDKADRPLPVDLVINSSPFSQIEDYAGLS